MQHTTSYQSYSSAGLFSKLVIDYLADDEKVKSLYSHRPDFNGIGEAIKIKSKANINRTVLVSELKKQYESVSTSDKVTKNIDSLLNENVFTVCTAHQPNIFTGHLYFIYKIIHAIKLADDLNQAFADFSFVPVYYMGSEDADLEELGEVFISNTQYQWETSQKGAVGKMIVDETLIALISQIETQLSIEPFGKEIVSKVKAAYTIGKTIQQATFEFVNELFQHYGLVVLIPDNKSLKRLFKGIVENELTTQFSKTALLENITLMSEDYKIQTLGRDINLFYLKDNLRERIEWVGEAYRIVNTDLVFSKDEIINELNLYPERFSPNVVLRPLYQELILPNVAFVGGGGELAYWLEFKKIFEVANLPYPVLILRNSFSIIESSTENKIQNLGLDMSDFYKSADDLFVQLLNQNSAYQLELHDAKNKLTQLYDEIKSAVAVIDKTLIIHTEALHTKALKKIIALEKKMLRAEKRKHQELLRQIESVKNDLFPNGVLQERKENLLMFAAKYDKYFIDMIYKSSTSLDFEYCNIVVK